MSFILDALKKADRDRQPVTVPTLASVHRTPAPSRRRPLWPWIAGAVIVVNAGVWLWLQRPAPSVPEGAPVGVTGTPATSPAPPPAALEQATPARPVKPVITPDPPDKAAVAVAPSQAPPSATRSASSMPLSQREQNLGVTPRAATKPDAPVTAKSAPNAESQKSARADARTPSAGEKPARVTSAGAAAPSVASSPKSETAPEKSPAPAVASTPVKPLERGPASPPTSQESSVPQEVLAKLHLQVLVYSEVPSKRLVFINNQKYVEGQRIDADLVVERITSDGAVLSYQGKRLVLRSDQPASR